MWPLKRGGHWPVTLDAVTAAGEPFRLRPLVSGDETAFHRVRAENADWLGPWDATHPQPGAVMRTFAEMVRHDDTQARAGHQLPWAIEVGGALVGQVRFANIVLGSLRNATVGYWIARSVAGRGIMPMAVATGADYLFTTLGLHRIEVNIRPENTASLAVVRKLGLREEGMRLRFLHIDGHWRDHRSFAVTVEDVGPEGLVGRLQVTDLENDQSH